MQHPHCCICTTGSTKGVKEPNAVKPCVLQTVLYRLKLLNTQSQLVLTYQPQAPLLGRAVPLKQTRPPGGGNNAVLTDRSRGVVLGALLLLSARLLVSSAGC